MYNILSINPGSTSTKVAIYSEERQIFSVNVEHDFNTLDKFEEIIDQLDYRVHAVQKALKDNNADLSCLTSVVGRGGLFPNMQGGGYLVNQELKNIVLSGKASPHPSNLGAFLADEIAAPLGIPAYIYDAVTADEFQPMAAITGMPDVKRQSMCHVLNMRSMARKIAEKYNTKYEEMRIIAVHMGGGISLSVHENGKIIDGIRDDEGPFSPERTGSIPLLYIIDKCFSGDYTRAEMIKKVRGMGGLKAYFGTPDCREIEKLIVKGDEKARLIYEAQAYQVAKGVGELATVLYGKIDCIILTGGVANSKLITDMIIERVGFLAPVEIMPGENEMEALAMGGLRISRGEEAPKLYR